MVALQSFHAALNNHPAQEEPMSEPHASRRISRRTALKQASALGIAGAGSLLGFPAIVHAQSDAIRIGHLTPRTGFLGQIGEYGFKGATLAVDEANAAGGVLGRRIEMIGEDSVNPSTAVSKAQKLIERDKVTCIVGEVSSASALAIGEQALRYKSIFVNTGANSDALRGSNCNRYMFHVEGSNTMYTKTIGTWQKANNQIKGKRWYFLVADYAFGHDLYKVSSRFLEQNAGINAGADMIATNTPDYTPYILKIRQAKPDLVYSCLAGVDLTTFLKQYREYNLPFTLSGGAMDTILFWGAGQDSISGHWQSLWYHGLTNPQSQAFTKRFSDKFGGPPENQAWGDYVAVKIMLQSIAETKSTETKKLVDHLEQGASFDILKPRKGLFRPRDHQLLQEMYVVAVKDRTKMKDKWDIFDIVQPVPGPNESLELIQPTKEENPCTMAA
jgi:branched-chain amino acid transport system substrate-binding protein